MTVYTLPADFFPDGRPARSLFVYEYQSTRELTLKSKITLTSHLFSFLQEGEKEVHFQDQSNRMTNRQAMLITSGNCLMSEKLSSEKQYRSCLLVFEDAHLAAFQAKHPTLFQHTLPAANRNRPACFLFEQDPFIRAYTTSLRHLLGQSERVREELLPLKFEEIMLYLASKYPVEFPLFVASLLGSSADRTFRNVVEAHIWKNLSLDELAFLCNMSLSTFKRRFETVYGMPPIKWFHEKRMQQAAFLLKHEKARPSEIHLQMGYENLSSFIQAFKKEFGITPKAYQQAH